MGFGATVGSVRTVTPDVADGDHVWVAAWRYMKIGPRIGTTLLGKAGYETMTT